MQNLRAYDYAGTEMHSDFNGDSSKEFEKEILNSTLLQLFHLPKYCFQHNLFSFA